MLAFGQLTVHFLSPIWPSWLGWVGFTFGYPLFWVAKC